MHFTDMRNGLLVSNAIVAAGIPHAAGVALAARMRARGRWLSPFSVKVR